MNRSTLAVLVVGLLVVQGSVAGFAAGDSGAGNASNGTENDTTVEESDSSVFSNQSTDSNASTEEASSDAVGTLLSEQSLSASNSSPSGETMTETTETGSTAESNTTSTETTVAAADSLTAAETGTTDEQSEEDDGSQSSPTPAPTDGTPQADGSPAAATQPSAGAASAGASAPGASTGEPNATPPNGTQRGAAPSAGAAGAQNGTAPSGAPPSGAAPSGTTGTGAQSGAPAGGSGSAPAGVTSGGAQGGSTGASGGTGASAASPDAEFSVVSVSSDVPVGSTGNISVTIENTGEDATNAVVNLQSLSGDLLFGQSPNTSRFVGDWDEGESRTIEVQARAASTADTTEYPVRATVSYEDDDGNSSQSAPLTFGVTPDGEQQFSLSGVEGDLQVGESGTISGTITNEGPATATDAVLRFAPNGSQAVVPRQSQYVLGSLDPDESASFELPVAVNSTAEPGERQVPLVVQYYDSDGNPVQSQTLNARVDIGEETDDFEIIDVDSAVESGEDGTLSVTMENTGESVTDSTVSFQSRSGGILFGQSANASLYVEEWDAGDQQTFEFDVTATESTTDGSYPMQASVSYTDSDGDQGQSGPFRFGVTPDEAQDDFEVVSSSTDVQVGDTGTVSVTLENIGANASAATVSLQSLSGDITFGRTANATQFVGDWPVGAQRTVTINATASNETDIRSYPFQASVSYDDADGDGSQAGPFTVGVTPQPEQSFTISNTTSTLRVGDEGNVTAQITNRGPQNVSNAVVQLTTEGQNLNPQATEVAVGSLPANESANVSFPVEITESAETGPRQFSFVVEYDNRNGDTQQSGTLDTQVDVAPERDAFTVERANASVDVGSSNTVTLNVTNNQGSVVSNVNAMAFVDDPLSTSTSEAYIARLAPDETRQISFDVSASDSASEGQYPLSVDFEYETASGDSELSQTYEVPVDVAAAENGGILSSLGTIGLVALLVLLGVGWVWSRR